MLVLIGGKNFAEYTIGNKSTFTQSVREAMGAGDVAIHECETWRSQRSEREFLILLAKDHSCRIDTFDVDSFLSKYSRRWHMPSRSESFCDPSHQAGWLDLSGWYYSDKTVSVDLLVQDYDDHPPCLYTISAPYNNVPPGEERKYLRRYYVRGKWSGTELYTKHDGTKITEAEYQVWRSSSAVRW